jgi:hypothetical protein
MPFGVAKNGMRMYVPSWQLNPGSTMKAANRAASDAYFQKANSLSGGVFSAMGGQTAGMIGLTTQIVQGRLQAEFQARLQQTRAGFDALA